MKQPADGGVSTRMREPVAGLFQAFADPDAAPTTSRGRAAPAAPAPLLPGARAPLQVRPEGAGRGGAGAVSAELLEGLLWLAELLRFRAHTLAQDAAARAEAEGRPGPPRPVNGGLPGVLGHLVADLSAQVGRPQAPLDAPPALPPRGFLPDLARRFGLDPLEALLVVAAISPACDGRFAAGFGELGGTGPADRPSADLLGLLLGLSLAERAQLAACLRPGRTLERFALLNLDWSDTPELPVGRQPLDVPARLLWYLLDNAEVEPDPIRGIVRSFSPRWSLEEPPFESGYAAYLDRCIGRLRAASAGGEVLPLLVVDGPAGAGQTETAECVAAAFGAQVLEAQLSEVIFRAPAARLAGVLMREALLRGAVLSLVLQSGSVLDEKGDAVITDEQYRQVLHFIDEALRSFPLPIVVTGDYVALGMIAQARRPLLYLNLRLPDRFEQQRAVEQSLARNDVSMEDEVIRDVLNRYQLDHRTTEDVIRAAKALLQTRRGEGHRIEASLAEEALELVLSRNLGTLSNRIMARASWDDLVLQRDLVIHLKALRYLIEHRHQVFEEWGLRRVGAGRGVKALFAGPSGTGKTMAAEVIATDLRLPLYRVDTSQLMSKWVGETEKNIDRVFRDAQRSQAILLFDEADSLFGQRGNVEGGGDRWANLQVNYLLQRFETHDGVVLLTTNMPNAIDTAFARRMHFVIEFRLPDEGMRKTLWEQMLTSKLPLGRDIDVEFLAQRMELSAANIKNAIMAAAFLAAAEGTEVDMRQIVRGLQIEFQKIGRGATRSDFGVHFKHLDLDPS